MKLFLNIILYKNCSKTLFSTINFLLIIVLKENILINNQNNINLFLKNHFLLLLIYKIIMDIIMINKI